MRDCLKADWDPALLEHEMAEEVAVDYEDVRIPTQGPDALLLAQACDDWVANSAPSTAQRPRASPTQFSHLLPAGRWAAASAKTILFRGLRLRVSVLQHPHAHQMH